MIAKYIEILKTIGENFHFSNSMSLAIAEGLAFISLLVLSVLLTLGARLFIKKTVYRIIKKTSSKHDDLLMDSKILLRFCLLIPAILIKHFSTDCLPDFPVTLNGFLYLFRIYEVIIYTLVLDALVNTGADFYNNFNGSKAKAKPIKSLVQVLKIILYIICVLLVIAILLGKDIKTIVIGLGTLSAVLMLVFQSPILGFVGTIQLISNDMLRIGDWIVMGNADGNVLEINLTTVKVQNWDNTITTIPTSTLVTNQFTNWRGMSEGGGRQIKRSINIDISTIKFCTLEMLEKYKKYSLIAPYIEAREKEILEYNEANRVDTSQIINGRQQTNLGIFRAYLREYINRNPNLNHDMTMIVRQLQPTEFGVPIQIYVFSSKKEWASYENIQSDLFDHIMAAVPLFDLQIFQRPSSTTSKS